MAAIIHRNMFIAQENGQQATKLSLWGVEKSDSYPSDDSHSIQFLD